MAKSYPFFIAVFLLLLSCDSHRKCPESYQTLPGEWEVSQKIIKETYDFQASASDSIVKTETEGHGYFFFKFLKDVDCEHYESNYFRGDSVLIENEFRMMETNSDTLNISLYGSTLIPEPVTYYSWRKEFFIFHEKDQIELINLQVGYTEDSTHVEIKTTYTLKREL